MTKNELATVDETTAHLSISIQVLTDEAVYARCWAVAKAMAQSQGLVGKHLVGKPEACLSVLLVSMEWKLNPYMVAKCTYEPVPGGSIGFYGKLVRAIAEQSGRLEKPIQYEWYGDWTKVQGKFEKRQSTKTDRDGGPKFYHAATYTDKDEVGLGVIVRLFMKGEATPREFRMDLRQAQPRNSTLWALDPKTQLQYTATRRAVDLEAPEILLGMPFDEYGDMPRIGADRARDITPQEPPADEDPLLSITAQTSEFGGGGVYPPEDHPCTPVAPAAETQPPGTSPPLAPASPEDDGAAPGAAPPGGIDASDLWSKAGWIADTQDTKALQRWFQKDLSRAEQAALTSDDDRWVDIKARAAKAKPHEILGAG